MMFKKRINAEEARELFLDAFQPLSSTEKLAIEDCDGRILASDITAAVSVPNYRRAAMDGFAVRATDTLGAGSGSPVILNLGKRIGKCACVRVHTGSPVPEGADAVVLLEDTALHDDKVEVFIQAHPLKNVGELGEDIQEGDVILKKGHRLRPCDIAVLASLGIRGIEVFRKPLVAVIATGEELVARGKELKEGEVYETNGLMASLYVRKWGGNTKLFDIVTDDLDKIKEAVLEALEADMIIISGGTSVGRRDYVPSVIGSLGNLLVHGVGVSPGKPTALGIIEGKPVVCMPGYPVAGLVTLFFFARAAVRKLGNIPDEQDMTVRAVLSEKIPGRIGFKTFARVKLNNNGEAAPLAIHGAGILSSVAKGDGFVIIPENVEGYDKGEEVEVVLIE